MKKLYTILLCCLLCTFLCVPAFATDMMKDAKDAVSTAVEEGKDLITDLKDAVDPDGDGKPEAEGDGIVDDDTPDTEKDTDRNDSMTESSRDTADRETDRDTTNDKDETTGVIEGMELEKNGINPWAIVIAIIVVIAVLILIFILIPKRGR